MPSSSLEGQELDVVVWPTDRPGEFHVSEPNVAPSPASARRARLEQQLSDAVVQSLRDDPLRSDPIRVHDMVAVKLDECLWVRGRIESKIHYASGCVWRALLLDWGYSVEVAVQDVAALPPQFRSHGCYARRAVLAAVAPPSGQYEAEARTFLDKLLGGRPDARIVVLGLDDRHRLHVRLHVKLPSGRHYICLNDRLCERGFAVPTDNGPLTAVAGTSDFWDNLPRLPFQPPSHTEQSVRTMNVHDYVAEYMRLRKWKEAQPAQGSTDDVAPTRDANEADTPTKRGSPTAVPCSSGRSSPLSTSSTSSGSFVSILGSDGRLSSCGRGVTALRDRIAAGGGSSPRPGVDRPPPASDSPRPGAGAGQPSTVSLGRGCVRRPPSASVDLPNSGSVSFLPGGVPLDAHRLAPPPSRPQAPPLQSARPRALRSSNSLQSNGNGTSPACGGLAQPTRSTPVASANEEAPAEALEPPSTVSDRVVLDRQAPLEGRTRGTGTMPTAALEGAGPRPSDRTPTTPTASSKPKQLEPLQSESMHGLLELLKLAEGDGTVSFKAPSSAHSEFATNVERAIRPSNLLNLTEQGRILVRSADEPLPACHALNDIPFERAIQDGLKLMAIHKPKLIQAHVWETILRGRDVTFVGARRTGKTLGYLAPILNNLMDEEAYSTVPKGCAPLAVVVCATWQSVLVVEEYCQRLMSRVSGFKSLALMDGTVRTLNDSVSSMTNGLTLLAATAPALAFLSERSQDLVPLFDRCCHLVLDEADTLVKEHAVHLKNIFGQYQQAVQRTKKTDANGQKYFVPRQVIFCADHWTQSLEKMSHMMMQSPTLYIASCMEAAVYGRMELDVRFGTADEMRRRLVDVVVERRHTKTVVFCRSKDEVHHVADLLSGVKVASLAAHTDTIVTDLDFISQRWRHGSDMVLVCTDEVLPRLNIVEAATLVHFYIPHSSKYEFNYRLSLCLDKFQKANDTGESSSSSTGADPGGERPQSHLLLTDEFNHSLLTMVRLMQRFGLAVSDALMARAVLAFADREIGRRRQPLCAYVKKLGACPHLKFCSARHIVLQELDAPPLGAPVNGVVRLVVVAVHDTTRYYGRPLKSTGADGVVRDHSADYVLFHSLMQRRCSKNDPPVDPADVQVGVVCAWLSRDGFFMRVRVEQVLRMERGEPVEVEVLCVDAGDRQDVAVSELLRLADDLSAEPAKVKELILAGVKPVDGNSNWNRFSLDFVRERILNKEMDGRIVLALSSTLWLQPLVERKRLEGSRAWIHVQNVAKELLEHQLAAPNDGHAAKLYDLCRTGGFELPDHSVGLARRRDADADACEPTAAGSARHAFLPSGAQVCVSAVESPHCFYVRDVRFAGVLRRLEKEVDDCAALLERLERRQLRCGRLCLARHSGGGWFRACVAADADAEDDADVRVFFVDHGDYERVALEDVRVAPTALVERMPLQAICCRLPLEATDQSATESRWSVEAVEVFESLTREPQDASFFRQLTARVLVKEPTCDVISGGPRYTVALRDGDLDVAQELVQRGLAVRGTEPDEPDEPVEAEPPCAAAGPNDVSGGPIDLETVDVGGSSEWLDSFKETLAASGLALPQARPIEAPQDHSPLDSNGPPKSAQLPAPDPDAPVKSAGSRFPTTKWFQDDASVTVTFHLTGPVEYQLQVRLQRLVFSARVTGIRYELDVKLYAEIDAEDAASSDHSAVAQGVRVVLRKKAVGVEWNRLTATPLRLAWLSRDFDSWNGLCCLSDEDDVQVFQPDPSLAEYAFGDRQTDSSSDSESDLDDLRGPDEDFIDDFHND